MFPVQDSPEQIRGAADHSGGLSESLHTALAADVCGANPCFPEPWNGSQACGEDKYKERDNHCPLISAFYFFVLCVDSG